MNTTKLILALFFSIFLFSNCSDDDDNSIDSKSLPSNATTFIEQNLSGYKILKIEDLKPKNGDENKYKVSFDKDLTIIFTEMGFCVEAENNTKLPETLINLLEKEKIDQLKVKYPKLEIKKIDYYNWSDDFYQDVANRTKIILTNDTEVFLYSYLGINKINLGVKVKDSETGIFAKVQKFIDEYYTNVQVGLLLHAVESDGREVYKAYLTKSSTAQLRLSDRLPDFSGLVVFDSNGEWLDIRHIPAYPISEKILQTMTDYARERFVSMFPDKFFYEIGKLEDNYMIKVSNGNSVIISYKSGPVFHMNVIVEFINTHFGPSANERMYSTIIEKPSSDNGYYTTTVILDKSKPQVVKMESLADGIWLSLETTDMFIPESIVKTLPSKITTQLSKENLAGKVTKITRTADGSSFVVKAGSKEFVYPQAS